MVNCVRLPGAVKPLAIITRQVIGTSLSFIANSNHYLCIVVRLYTFNKLVTNCFVCSCNQLGHVTLTVKIQKNKSTWNMCIPQGINVR